MLLSCISAWNKNSLGKFLIDFLFYFGFYYNYHNYDYLPSNREET
jgi:DNA polymerase sigma